MTRSQLLSRLMTRGMRRHCLRLDSLYGHAWVQPLQDLAELRLVSYTISRNGEVKIRIHIHDHDMGRK